MRKHLYIYILVCSFVSCVSGGTHGSIKRYRYHVSKYELEKAIQEIISENPIIYQDSIKDYLNDDTGYVRIHIVQKGLPFTYVFRYYSDKEYWDTSKTSEIFIAYAYDAKHEGGSEGGIKKHRKEFMQELLRPFNQELISKIDTILNEKHTEE
ncbi:MAG: hypothetical protein JST70_06260 [Bacteroidetes bacterium]|nr:hypothetical protein [Bacteroidota bacterium]